MEDWYIGVEMSCAEALHQLCHTQANIIEILLTQPSAQLPWKWIIYLKLTNYVELHSQ